MTPLENAVVAAARALESAGVPYMVIGGLANMIWGEPRTTLDVDITAWVAESDIPRVADRLRGSFRLLPPDPIAFIRETRVLPAETAEGTRVEFVFGQLPFEERAIRRAVARPISGTPVRFCTAEDLIAHKIISDRPRDRDDVQGIIRTQGPRIDRAYLDPLVRELSAALERPELWSYYEGCFRSIG
jgi:hypothetical protein